MEGTEDRLSVSDSGDLVCIVESIDVETSLRERVAKKVLRLFGTNGQESSGNRRGT